MNARSIGSMVFLMVVLATAVGSAAPGPEVTVSAAEADEYLPRVAYDRNHDQYLVVWHQYWSLVAPGAAHRVVMGRRHDRYGVPIGAAFQISPAVDDRDRAQPDVVFDPTGNRFLVVYTYDFAGDGSDYDIRGRFVDWNGVNPGLPEFQVGWLGVSEWDPRVEYSLVSGSYLVTWWAESSPAAVYGAIGSFGNPPTGSFVVAQHASAARVDPDLAYQTLGDRFLVVYSSTTDIFGTLVGPDGSLGSELDIAAWPDSESAPSVATCGEGQYLVAWHSEVGVDNRDVYARALWADGAVVDGGGPFAVADTGDHDAYPEVSCSDITYLVVYQGQYPNDQYGTFARELRAGSFATPAEMEIRPRFVGEAGDVTTRPTVAGGGTAWLTVWEHDRQPAGTVQDIHGAAVWDLFGAGFEWGGSGEWSTVVP